MVETKPIHKFQTRKEAKKFYRFLRKNKNARVRVIELKIPNQWGAGLSLPPNNQKRSIHVQFGALSRGIELFSHSEPDSIADPDKHKDAVLYGTGVSHQGGKLLLFKYMKQMRKSNCRRCGRILSNPTSLSRGYGPTCWKKK